MEGKSMPIKARYENGVFRPLDAVVAEEVTLADVYLPVDKAARLRQLRESPAYGMWADRDDIRDGVDYVNRLRKYRREPQPGAEQKPERR
jgi:predicted DNA-binding antitoxin AbrB/MazE fold protein